MSWYTDEYGIIHPDTHVWSVVRKSTNAILFTGSKVKAIDYCRQLNRMFSPK